MSKSTETVNIESESLETDGLKLKHFELDPRKGRKGIILFDKREPPICLEDSIFSISTDGNTITITEECDQYFSTELSFDDAIAMLNEAIAWIKDERA